MEVLSELENNHPTHRIQPKDDAETIRRKRRALRAMLETRIKADPISGGETKLLSQILADVAKGLDRKIVRARQGRANVRGSYVPGSTLVTIRSAGDLGVAAHEIGHALDDQFGIVAEWNEAGQRSPFDGELLPRFSQYTSSPRDPLAKRRAEAVAEWFRAWVLNPDAAETAAPTFAAHVKKMLPAETLGVVKSFSDDARRFAGLSAHDRTGANVEWEPSDGTKESANSVFPIRKVAASSPASTNQAKPPEAGVCSGFVVCLPETGYGVPVIGSVLRFTSRIPAAASLSSTREIVANRTVSSTRSRTS
jgi:hypothetical protein